jgi:lysylphosphatidylglycerol synthetase-like protein (DUF2156 family)
MASLRFGTHDLMLMVLAIAAISLLCLALLTFMDFREASAENGPIESVQLAALAIALVVFLIAAFRIDGVERAVAVAAAAVAAAAFSREFRAPIDFSVLDFISSPIVRTIVVIALLAVAGFALLRDADRLPALMRWITRLGWWPFLLSMALLLLGDRFEKMAHTLGIQWEFLEEVVELDGYTVFLAISVLMWHKATLVGNR